MQDTGCIADAVTTATSMSQLVERAMGSSCICLTRESRKELQEQIAKAVTNAWENVGGGEAVWKQFRQAVSSFKEQLGGVEPFPSVAKRNTHRGLQDGELFIRETLGKNHILGAAVRLGPVVDLVLQPIWMMNDRNKVDTAILENIEMNGVQFRIKVDASFLEGLPRPLTGATPLPTTLQNLLQKSLAGHVFSVLGANPVARRARIWNAEGTGTPSEALTFLRHHTQYPIEEKGVRNLKFVWSRVEGHVEVYIHVSQPGWKQSLLHLDAGIGTTGWSAYRVFYVQAVGNLDAYLTYKLAFTKEAASSASYQIRFPFRASWWDGNLPLLVHNGAGDDDRRMWSSHNRIGMEHPFIVVIYVEAGCNLHDICLAVQPVAAEGGVVQATADGNSAKILVQHLSAQCQTLFLNGAAAAMGITIKKVEQQLLYFKHHRLKRGTEPGTLFV